jgi:hypothetical protein
MISLRLPEMEPVPYNGDRSLKALQEAVIKFVSAPFFTPISSLEIQNTIKKNEVAFFLIFNPNIMESSILNNLEIAVRPWVGTVNLYVTPDDAYSLLGSKESKDALLVVSKEYGMYMESFNNNFGNSSLLSAWIKEKKDTLLLELDSSNQVQVFSGESLIVLALVDPDANKTIWVPSLQSAVKSWKPVGRPVIFVWLDAITHSGYAERVYSVKSNQLPYLVIADPLTNEYYNLDSEGKRFAFVEGKIPTYVLDIINGKLTAKSSSGVLGKIARKMINLTTYASKMISNNSWIIVIMVLMLLYILYTCIRINFSDNDNVGNSKKD